MEYYTGNPRKFILTKKGTPGKKIFFMQKYRDLLEKAPQSTSPAHNCKWEGEFQKTIMRPTVTMLLARATRLGEDFFNYPHIKNCGQVLNPLEIYGAQSPIKE